MRLITAQLKYYTVFSILFLCSALSSYADTPRPIQKASVQALGMGNSLLTRSGSTRSFLNNPAFLGAHLSRFEPVNISFIVNPESIAAFQFLQRNHTALSTLRTMSLHDAESLLQNITPFEDHFIGISSNFHTGFTKSGIGLAGNITAHPSIMLDRGIYEPKLYARGFFDVTLSGGYGFQIKPQPGRTVLLGLTGHVIQRHEAHTLRVSASQYKEINTLLTGLIDTLRSPKMGWSLDIGALYQIKSAIRIGAVIHNIGYLHGHAFPILCHLGLSYQKKLLHQLFNNLTLSAEYHDVFNTLQTNPFTHLHIGATIQSYLLQLRIGNNQGYMTIGAGLTMGPLKCNYAYYGIEIGQGPGHIADYNHGLELSLLF